MYDDGDDWVSPDDLVAKPAELRGPGPEAANCDDCPLARGKHRAVRGEGCSKPRMIVIAEGPGSTEISLGRPLVGESGKLLMRAMLSQGVKREEVWLGNATLCPPGNNDDASVRRLAAYHCKNRLAAELAQFVDEDTGAAPAILALGGVAANALLNPNNEPKKDVTISKIASTLHNVNPTGLADQHMIAQIHPAAILRGGGGSGAHDASLIYWNLQSDIKKVAGLSDGSIQPFSADVIVANNDQEGEDAWAKIEISIRRHKRIAVDTETRSWNDKRWSALQPLRVHMHALGIATVDMGISFDTEAMLPAEILCLEDHTARIVALRAYIQEHPVFRRIAKVLADPAIVKIYHNRLYDIPVLENHGFRLEGAQHCTVLLHHVAYPGAAHNLQAVVAQQFPVKPWKSEFRNGVAEKGETRADLLDYNAKDTLGTARVFHPLFVHVKQCNAERAYKFDLRMAAAADEMHRTGIPVDRDENEALKTQFDRVLQESEASLNEIFEANREPILEDIAREQAKRQRKSDSDDYLERIEIRRCELQKEIAKGKFKWSVDASDQLIALLKALKVTLTKRTEKGKVATDKEVLEQLGHIPQIRNILDYRQSQKMLSTFVDPMFDRHDDTGKLISYGYVDNDGRIHPRWSIHKISSRWASEDPIVSNVPKDDAKKGRPNLRQQFKAKLGRILVGFDKAQLEVRIIALLSGDKFLLEVFRDNKDIHTELAKVIWPTFPWHAFEIGKKLVAECGDDKKKAAAKYPSHDWKSWAEGKVMRDTTKRSEFGTWYRGGIEAIWRNIIKDYPSVKMADIARLVAVMKKNCTGVAAWHEELAKRVARAPHELRSHFLERRRVFPLGNASPTEYSNIIVQTSATELVNMGLDRIMPRLHNDYHDAHPIIHMHDAIVFECDEDDGDRLLSDVNECFYDEHESNGVTMKFPIDAKIANNWADL